jgi:hypothetical protein
MSYAKAKQNLLKLRQEREAKMAQHLCTLPDFVRQNTDIARLGFTVLEGSLEALGVLLDALEDNGMYAKAELIRQAIVKNLMRDESPARPPDPGRLILVSPLAGSGLDILRTVSAGRILGLRILEILLFDLYTAESLLSRVRI